MMILGLKNPSKTTIIRTLKVTQTAIEKPKKPVVGMMILGLKNPSKTTII
jgi:hypothetical protein